MNVQIIENLNLRMSQYTENEFQYTENVPNGVPKYGSNELTSMLNNFRFDETIL